MKNIVKNLLTTGAAWVCARALRRHAGLVAATLAALLTAASPAAAQGPGMMTPPSPVPLNPALRAAIVDSVSAALATAYVYADTAAKMGSLLHVRLALGEYDSLATSFDFADRLTRDLQSVSHDRHLRALPAPPEGSTPAQDTSADRQRAEAEDAATRNYDFVRAEVLEGNIGYLDLRSFVNARYAGPTAIAAMNFLGHTDAVIFDLRKNGGGDPTLIDLITSYFVEAPTHLNSFYVRETDHTDQFWTQAWVPGPRLEGVPVYVLTSHFTFSGAEEFSYNLKALKRATLVGETTGGGAHPVRLRGFPGLPVAMMLPYGRAVNPVTNTNWEGTGVEPDIQVPEDQALAVAHREALKALLEKAGDPARKQTLQWTLDGLEWKSTPFTPAAGELREFAGLYGPRTVSLKDGTLFYQREGGPVRRLVPARRDTFFVDGADYFRVRFARDERGRVVKLVGLYSDGHQDESPRSGNERSRS